MPKLPKLPKMPKMSAQTGGLLGAAAVAAVVVAMMLSEVMQGGLGLPGETVRDGALNVASLVVALLLVAGVGRRQKKDKR